MLYIFFVCRQLSSRRFQLPSKNGGSLVASLIIILKNLYIQINDNIGANILTVFSLFQKCYNDHDTFHFKRWYEHDASNCFKLEAIIKLAVHYWKYDIYNYVMKMINHNHINDCLVLAYVFCIAFL